MPRTQRVDPSWLTDGQPRVLIEGTHYEYEDRDKLIGSLRTHAHRLGLSLSYHIMRGADQHNTPCVWFQARPKGSTPITAEQAEHIGALVPAVITPRKRQPRIVTPWPGNTPPDDY